ncbi:dihydrofolate reductase [Bactrocera oleae]|uniref:dihydrofolate reductase n=1 Tax=Bactrocera oleae TaxID=104688 RepID=UPI0006B7E25A|nr:dihydrofolate reductase [Bactrocera oleae]
MEVLKFNLIAAISENFGIGVKGELPWRLRSELKYFSSTTRRCFDPKKQNVVIMGRKTYFAIPEDKRPLFDRLNVVLSTTLKTTDLPENVLLYPNLESAMQRLEQFDLSQQIETVWIVGGSGVYKEAILSPRCNRIYLTKILQQFECDTFFPEIPADFQELKLDQEKIPMGIQKEGGVQYEYKILEKRKRE